MMRPKGLKPFECTIILRPWTIESAKDKKAADSLIHRGYLEKACGDYFRTATGSEAIKERFCPRCFGERVIEANDLTVQPCPTCKGEGWVVETTR